MNNLIRLKIVLFLLISTNVSAQTISLKFENILVEDGLSQNTVRCILQDKTGFLWFGTEDGLNRYDGYEFIHFRNDASDSTSISHNSILSLFEDQYGFLWVGTNGGGLNKYDRSSGRFTTYRYNSEDNKSISGDAIRVIYEDRSGTRFSYSIWYRQESWWGYRC